MSDKCTIELKDKAKERYEIKRSFSYGKELNVYKAYERNNPNIHYVIKSYNTKEGFERELQTLKELSGAKNITQMVDNYPDHLIIVCECALYDLETFLGHQDYIQRHEEKGNIIKDIVSGLLELQKHNIVHTELSPGNIMYFQENNGCTESWKLIDFDTACFVGSYYAKIKMNYSAPEVIRAQEEGIEIKADFSMDMFSFGLVLYFIETGRHYWDGLDREDEELKRDIISGNKYLLLLQNIRDQNACWVIRSLLDKDISHRMKLDRFMRTPYYTGESKSTNINKFESDYEINEELFQLYQSKFTQKVIEEYHNEMKESLKRLNDKVDNCKKAVEDLTDITKEIPQWLVKLQNEKVPRVFVMIPDQKDWKKPATWLLSKPFRLLFVCEHKEQWHVPEQDGHKLLEVPQFIKKYGPWINLCLQTLFSAIKIMTSDIFPQGVAEIFSSVFSVKDNSDLMHYFQEIMDTVDIGVKTMIDEDPTFLPLSDETYTSHQMINASGLRELERFLDKQDCADKFGGLVQCVDDNNEILWLCEEHRSGYSPISTTSTVNPPEPLIIPPDSSESNGPSESNGTQGSNGQQNYFNNRELGKLLPIDPQDPETFLPWRPPFMENTLKWDYNKFYIKSSTDPLDPYYALDYVCVILGEVIENVVESGRKHFRRDDLMEIAQKMRANWDNLNRNWCVSDQKIQFLKILRKQVHHYNRFIWLIIRYCAVKDRVTNSRLAKMISILYHDIDEIRSIIKSGRSFNDHLSKLITALRTHDNIRIQSELKSFSEDPCINLYIDYESSIPLSRWYYVASQAYYAHIETPTDIGIQEERLFDTTRRVLNNTTVTGKSLRCLNDENYHCLIKEIYLYNDRHLNNNKYIIEFRGYSIQHCKCTLFYEYADFGDLFEYFQANHYPSNHHLSDWKNKIKLAWEISRGVKYLHSKKIVHLDLRSANILLKYDENEKTLMPKISNFLWSRDFYSGKTSVYPTIIISSGEEVWKRWYDPQRLSGMRQFQIPTTSADIYSLGLLFWEIAWCKPGNWPFKEVSIENLYHHLREYNHENLPELPLDYRHWGLLINKMWKFKAEDRYDIMTVEIVMQKLYKGRSDSTSSVSSSIETPPISPISPSLI